MIPIYKKPYKDGDLQIGWASWDKDAISGKQQYQKRSVKYSYPSKNGHISRGAPEIPLDIMLDMAVYAAEHGVLDDYLEQVKAAYEALGEVLKRTSATDSAVRPNGEGK